MKRNLRISLLSFYFALLSSLIARSTRAQDVTNQLNTGIPENGIFHGTDIESVQVTNGNLHIAIPIWSTAGRNLGAGYQFLLDNKGWDYSVHCNPTYGTCSAAVVTEQFSNMSLTL